MKPSEKRGKRDGRSREGGRDGRGRGRGDRNDRGDKKPYARRELPKEDTPESSGTRFSSGTTPGYKKGGFSGFFGTYLGKEDEEDVTPVTKNEPTMSEGEASETPSEE